MVALRLAAAAERQHMRCSAWVPGVGPAAEALDRQQTRWRRYDLPAMKRGGLRQLSACAYMVPGLLASRRPIVHVHDPTVYGLIRPALIAAGARTVVHFHIEPDDADIEWTLKAAPSHIITCASYIARKVEAVAKSRSQAVPITPAPNAVDQERFTPGDREAARATLGLGTSRFVVLMLANLAPHKGQATAIRAVDLLTRRGMPVECWLVGEDRTAGQKYRQELQALCEQLQLGDRVRFLGFRRDSPELLRAADAFVLPSTHEGLPLSVLEAQATRIPVVGSTIPGIREVVEDGTTGFLVPAEDFTTYADRLQTLFQNAALRNQLTANAAAQVASQYGWPVLEERIFAAYRSLFQRP